MLNRWGRFALFSLPVLVLGPAAILGFYARVQLDSSTDTMLAGDQRGRELVKAVTNLLSQHTVVGIVAERDDWVCDDGAAIIDGISHNLRALEGCIEVRSLTFTGYPTVNRFLKPGFKEFMPRRVDRQEEWDEHREFLLEFPLSRNLLISADGRHTIIGVMLDREMPTHADRKRLREEVHEAIEPFRDHTISMHSIGLELAQAEVVDTFLRDGLRYGVAFFLFAGLVILVTFRSPPIGLLVLGYLAFGLAMLAFVFMANEHRPNLYTSILIPLVSGLQLTFLVHFFAAWQREMALIDDTTEALALCLREVLVPSGIAAITTVIGLFSLMACNVEIVRMIGALGAMSVVLMFVGTFLPALAQVWFSPHRHWLSWREEVPESVPRTTSLVRPALVLPLVALVAAACVPALFRVKTDVRATEYLERGSETQLALAMLNDHVGGIYVFAADLTFPEPYGAQKPEALAFQERLRREANAMEGVGECYTYSQLFTTFNAGLKGSRDYETLPTGLSLTAITTVLNTFPFMFKNELQNKDASSTSFFMRTTDMPAADYLALIERLIAKAEELRPEGVELVPRAGIQTFLQGDRKIVNSLVSTLGISLFAVLLTLCLLWRSWRLGLAGLLVTVPALLVIGGLMGWCGFRLNAVTVMLSALILGIAVDDAIHVITLFKHLRELKAEDKRQAATWAVRRKIKPMACTSAILVCLFGLLAMSSFPPVAQFGLLAAASLVVALLSSLFLLPVLLQFAE